MTVKKFKKEDTSFQDFSKGVDFVLKRNIKNGSPDQKALVENLLALEKQFSSAINEFSQTDEIYRQFIVKIVVLNKNILSAKPYFRDRAQVFTSQITPAIKDVNIKKLKTFNINYSMIKFIKDSWKGVFPKKAGKILVEIDKTRNLLIENNLPLAINYAKRFYRKVPRSHLSLMDMVALCSAGLTVGVDKWHGPYSPVFRSTCLGRMTANLLEAYNETAIHFTPTEKKILYRANGISFKKDTNDLEFLTKEINKTLDEDDKKTKAKEKSRRITSSELQHMLGAAYGVTSAGEVLGDGHEIEESDSFDFLPENSKSQEDIVVESEVLTKAYAISKELNVISTKVLKLRGYLT